MANQTDDTTDKGTHDDGTPRQRRRFEVPSTWIAQKTGYNRQGIWRLRMKGDRDRGPIPMERMTRMRDAFGWSVDAQFAAFAAGRWIDDFEDIVSKAYAAEQKRAAQ